DAFTAMGGSGPNDVWVVGDDGGDTGPANILHWDGSAWSRNFSSDAFFVLNGVWASAPDDAWIVGNNGNILHWDGSNWSLTGAVTSGTTESLQGIWGSTANDVWAVGQHGTVLRWDGTHWRPIPSGTIDALMRVWGAGPNDIWAVGGFQSARVIHWDGAS